ncbi:MAG: aldose epimerase family protein [Lutimonas sp.]
MTIAKSNFGKLDTNQIDLYTLSNANGMNIKITNYGATITSITVPIHDEMGMEVACGFDSLEGYLSETYKNNAPYFGSTVGRYTSQIKDARFSLNGKDYILADNCGANNLHGGKEGFDKKIWKAEPIKVDQTTSALKMSLTSKDMEEGFPGNVEVTVIFLLNDDNELEIHYEATPDHDTPLSLTNHTYFNLSGFDENIENHIATVNSNQRLALDDSGAATGEILNIAGEFDDLRDGKRIGEVHELMNDGFEHFYIFENSDAQLKNLASVSNTKNGLVLDVFSNEPCMLLYTGKYTSDDLRREGGGQYGKFRAFCCETHRYPNGPNISEVPGSITKANEKYKSATKFRFSW